ncbi:MAG: HEAT repeat domain-containing protein, partial [Planctomycetota bacterium]
MTNRKGNSRTRLVLALVAGLAAPRAPDLDVAIPPGSPLDWGGSFPGYTPPEEPLFPVTRTSAPDPQRTSAASGARGAAAESEVRFAQSFSLLRILTWDLTAHLPWITSAPKGPLSGSGPGRPTPPRYGDPLYWVGLAPLLRLMLHPEVSSTNETLAHLVELGDPLFPVLSASAAERSLGPSLVRLRELIPPGGSVPSGTFEGAPRARLFARFTLEECLRDEPYDPVGEFGKRLFLFHEDVAPWLETYAEHPSLALRRNAVAALARYRTRASASALARVAASERDPVTLVRALAALAGFRGKLDEAPLVARGLAEPDPVLRAAWIGALGRMGARSAVSGLVELGEGALARGDSELLLTLLGALAQIPPTAEHARVVLFARRVHAEVHGEPSRWRAKGPRGAEAADVPDAGDARAEWLEQLALFVQVAAEPLDEDLHRRLLALGRPAAADPRVSGGPEAIDSLAGLAPGARLLYLHVLAQIGELGQERLAALALDAGLEPALRGRALALTSYDRRAVLGLRLAADPAQPPEVRIQALEILRVDRHEGLDGPCQKLFDELLAAPTLTTLAPQRYLWNFALRQRVARGPLPREALFALWK